MSHRKNILFTVSDSTPLSELYRRLSQGIDIIETHSAFAHKRAPTKARSCGLKNSPSSPKKWAT